MEAVRYRANPSLWRTCRVLANLTRLRILRYLLQEPRSSVSDVARALHVRVSLASQYLRALNARGLIQASRVGRNVYYRPGPDETIPQAQPMLTALHKALFSRRQTLETIFRTITAFTHPRRAHILQTLHEQELTYEQLKIRSGISRQALSRHVSKLRQRRFVNLNLGKYRSMCPHDSLGKTLYALIVAGKV